MTRGQLATRVGCHPETVRYYETARLLKLPARTANGYRAYTGSDERRLRFIVRGRELGFTIDDLRGLLDLVDRNTVTCAGVKRAALLHLADVQRKIRDLRRMERTLKATTAKCRGDNKPECLFIATLSRD